VQGKAILVGNTDGIGLATTRRLLASGWEVVGISRSPSSISDKAYRHCVADVSASDYPEVLEERVRAGPVDLCIYFAAVGEWLEPLDMSAEAHVIEVNLLGMVKTAAGVIPYMVQRGQGHFIGISSQADELWSPTAPSYCASKAGFSNYLAGLALALRSRHVYVTNIRFGFVDTKMAKGAFKPFMMNVEKAVDHVEHCIRSKPACYTAPLLLAPFIQLLKLLSRIQLRLGTVRTKPGAFPRGCPLDNSKRLR
jgi:short-subunit dehydrogenase